jgi:hypothetical protein
VDSPDDPAREPGDASRAHDVPRKPALGRFVAAIAIFAGLAAVAGTAAWVGFTWGSRPLGFVLPDVTAAVDVVPPRAPDAGPGPAGPSVCVLGPSDDLRMLGAWRERTPAARTVLSAAGFAVDCEVPYIRSAPRFGAASARGLVQHDGSDPEGLARLVAALRPLYPRIGIDRVETSRLFRAYDVFVPDAR